MVAFNFMARFAPSIEDGTKRQTIRAAGKRRPPFPGEQLQLYTGMRTGNCRKLRDAVCQTTVSITISPKARVVRHVVPTSAESGYWDELSPEDVEQLAIDDGFSSADEFFAWFEKAHGDHMSGFLIRWEV